MSDLERALLDPTSVFDHPQDVLTHKGFSDEQKIEILRRWEYDARELHIAAAENMPAANDSLDMLDQVLKALHQLGVWRDQ